REPPAQLYEIEYVPKTEDLLVPGERADDPLRQGVVWLRARDANRLQQAQIIAARIAAIIANGEPKIDGCAPTWRDVAILAPTNTMLDAAAFALAEARIPYVVAGRGFYASTEVRDLASLLALIVDPHDRCALLDVLRGPWVGARDETLIGLTAP